MQIIYVWRNKHALKQSRLFSQELLRCSHKGGLYLMDSGNFDKYHWAAEMTFILFSVCTLVDTSD